jgi:hypothetical protein
VPCDGCRVLLCGAMASMLVDCDAGAVLRLHGISSARSSSSSTTMRRRASIWLMDKNKPRKNPAAVALGRLGAKKGGRARMAQLTPAERTALARRAALARWERRGKG